MLGKPKQIFISYGARRNPKTDFVIEAIISELQKLRGEGYRIEYRLIDENYWVAENGEIPFKVRDAMERADGAIIILTPSDIGGSVEGDTAPPKLQSRARQNVIHEYGFLQARLPHRTIKVFADIDVEIPSNLIGFSRVLLPLDRFDGHSIGISASASMKAREDIERQIRIHTAALATETLQAIRVDGPPIYVPTWRINLTNFVHSRLSVRDVDIASEWAALFNEIESPLDKLLVLFERVVFDSYLYPLDVWSSVLERLSQELAGDAGALALVNGLHYVRDYQNSATSERLTTNSQYRILVGTKLDEIIDGLERAHQIANHANLLAPIVHIVLKDYLGLSQLRKAYEGTQNSTAWWFPSLRGRSAKHQLAWLDRSIASLDYVTTVASNFESVNHPVWQGFAFFNLARAQKVRFQISGGSDQDWKRSLDKAIDRRDKLCAEGIMVPERIQVGFISEYLHACLFKASTLLPESAAELLAHCRPRYDILKGWRGPRFPLRNEVERSFEAAIARSK